MKWYIINKYSYTGFVLRILPEELYSLKLIDQLFIMLKGGIQSKGPIMVDHLKKLGESI